jgi:hypothetical protein
MLFGTLFTLPSASSTLEGLSAYSSPIFSDFWPAIELVGGIAIGIGVVAILIIVLTRVMHRD